MAYTDYNPIYDGDWSAFAVHCNVCHGKWKRMDGSQKTTICRICEQPEHSVQVFMKQWLCIKGDLWFQTEVEEDISNRFKMLDISNRFKIWDFKYILNVDLWLHSCTASNPPSGKKTKLSKNGYFEGQKQASLAGWFQSLTCIVLWTK